MRKPLSFAVRERARTRRRRVRASLGLAVATILGIQAYQHVDPAGVMVAIADMPFMRPATTSPLDAVAPAGVTDRAGGAIETAVAVPATETL